MKKIIGAVKKLLKVKTAINYSTATLLKTAGTILAGIIVIKFVKPEEIGLWNSLMIISSYTPFLRLGIMKGLNRELPFLLGANRRDEAEKLAASAKWYALFLTYISLVLIIVSLLIIYFFKLEVSKNAFVGIIGVGIVISSNFYFEYLVATFRSEKAFNSLAKAHYIQFLIIISTIPIVYFYGFYGLILYNSLVALSLMTLMHIVRPIRIRSSYNFTSLLKLAKTGIPLFVFSFLLGVSKSFPKIILLSTGGVLAVGLFAPANAINIGMRTLPGILSQYFYPQMSYSFGKYNDKKRLWTMAWKISGSLFFFGLTATIVLWPIISYAIPKYFPDYIQGIFPAQMALLSGVFTGSLVSVNALASIKANKSFFVFSLSKAVLFFLVPWVLTQFYEPLMGVAIGIVIANFLQFILGMFLLYVNLFKADNSNG